MASPPLSTSQPHGASPGAASFAQQPPAQDDWDDGHDNYETDNYGNDDYDDDDEEEDNDAHIDGDEELGEDETIEEFESRVLNKRAALLHRQLARNFTDTFSEHLGKRYKRKQVAQKFHSILVLQKMMTLNLSQDEHIPYSEISLAKGPAWDGANHWEYSDSSIQDTLFKSQMFIYCKQLGIVKSIRVKYSLSSYLQVFKSISVGFQVF